MAQFNELNTDYLTDTISRVVEMLGVATPNVQALDYIDPNLTPPFWWVYLGKSGISQESEDISHQNYIIVCRFVVGFATQGIDGEAQRSLYSSVPRMVNFFFAHKNFMFTKGDGSIPHMLPPKYLNSALTIIMDVSTFGAFQDNLNHVGMEEGISVSFRLGIDQEY